jgi:hypothetical protein
MSDTADGRFFFSFDDDLTGPVKRLPLVQHRFVGRYLPLEQLLPHAHPKSRSSTFLRDFVLEPTLRELRLVETVFLVLHQGMMML